MSSYNKSGSNWGEVGCVAIIGLLLLPYILREIFIAIIPYIVIGGAGFILFRVYMYDRETRNITYWLEDKFKSNQSKSSSIGSNNSNDKSKMIESPKENEELALKILNEKLQKEKETIRKERKKDIEDAIKQFNQNLEKNNKEQVFEDIFCENESDYARSTEFEEQEFYRTNKKKEDDLENRSLKLEVKEQLFKQEKKIVEIADEARQDRYYIRAEMKDSFEKVAIRFTHVEGDLSNFKVYVGDKFNRLELFFNKEINALKELINNVRIEFKNDISDIKLQFGKEILRLDRQQIGIIDRMQKYENQVRAFSIDMQKLKNEAERFAIRGEDLLNRANTIHQRHKTAMELASGKLDLGLKEMSLKNVEFSNSVTSAKLQLDEITKDQYLTLKDIAYERIGINMVKREHDQRNALEQERMGKLIQEKRFIEHNISDNISRGKEVAGLKHQLHTTQENLNHTIHRANLLKQEAGIVRKLTR